MIVTTEMKKSKWQK